MLTRNDGRADLPALLWEAGLTLFLVLLLDLTFDLYFWHVPKLTSRSSDYSYQFLVDVRQLSQAKVAGRLRVVAFGSSVAGSFDAAQVQSLLRAAHPEVDLEVQRLLVPGIKPSDYRLFFAARGDALGADVAVLPLNLVDFLNPSVDRGVKPQVRRVLPAWPTLREKWSELPTVGDRLDLAFAAASHLYRYRGPLVSAAVDHARWLLRWLRARPTIAYGFFADGYSERRLGFPAAATGGEVEYYVDPEWIRQRGQVRLTATLDGAPVAERLESAPGWKRLHWQPGESGRLEVRLDSAWNRRAGAGDDDVRLLGVNLRPAPPDDWKKGTPPVEYPPFRDAPELLRMGAARGDEYVRRWQEILHADSAFARRMQAYYQAKTEVREQTFDAGGEYAALRELVRYLVARGVAVVLVNNPESPLILPEYESSDYYRAYRAFLRDLAAPDGGVHFHDLAAALPAEDFNDWHHVNYIGAIKLGPRYAAMVAAALPRH